MLAKANSPWKPIYRRGKFPVLVERRWGAGSLVVGTDSYLVSNQALRGDRQPEVLSWFIGGAKRVIFDEAHLGLTEQLGAGVLFRQYRLWPMVAAVGIVALLFVWRNSASLLPPRRANPDDVTRGGRAAALGFVNLLRRNIPPAKLVDVCLAEWVKAAGRLEGPRQERLRQAQSILNQNREASPGRRDPVREYREISRVLESSKSGRQHQ
jgi:hypothetical protein